jgi:hypothetical protein
MFVASCDPILAQKWTSLVYLYNQDAYEMHVKATLSQSSQSSHI